MSGRKSVTTKHASFTMSFNSQLPEVKELREWYQSIQFPVQNPKSSLVQPHSPKIGVKIGIENGKIEDVVQFLKGEFFIVIRC